MTVKPELLKKIREHFGLNIYETKVWTALLTRGIATAGEIAEISSVPRSRTYDVLESLERRGFAIEKIGKPIKFIAVKPGVVLERLKSKVITDAEEKAKILTELKTTDDYKQIELIHKQGIQPIKANELTGALKGKANIYSHLKEMMEKASKNIVMTTNASALKKKMKVIKPLLNSFKRKGVKLRIAVNGNDEEIEAIAKEMKIHGEIRKTELSARFCIIDNDQLLFMLEQNPQVTNEDTGIWVTSPYFASALSSMFDLAWRK